MGLTVIYTKKDTKYCSFPRFKHIDTRSHLILVIFQRKPFSNSLKHGDFFQLFVVPCVRVSADRRCGLWARNRPAANRQNQNSAKKLKKYVLQKLQWRNIFKTETSWNPRLVHHYWPVLYAVAKERVLPVIGAFKMGTLTILVESVVNGNWRFAFLFLNFTSRIQLRILLLLVCITRKFSIFSFKRYAEKLRKLEILKRLKKEHEKR